MRWIGGLILVLVVSLLGVTVGRKYLSRFTPAAAPEVERKSDERVTKLVQQGNQLLERGDLEAAKEQFDKATALSENDPGLLLALARLEVIRADQLWLRLRLLDPKDEGLVRLTHRQLGARVGKAQAALERARKVARQTTTGAESRPAAADEVSLVRSEVDARRMNGELELARSLVGPLLKNPTQPENAYVLAALDLADASPVWSSALERLRIAASAEQQLGRAQAALVYALTRAGKLNDAQSELEKMEARTDTHPLLPDLRGFVHRYSIVADAGAEAHKSAVAVDVAALPKLDTSPAPKDESDDAVKTPAPIKPGDFRLKLEEASVALHNGQLGRALQLYQEVQSAQPGNTEALAGLADVESRRGNSAKAAELYQSVLAQNPSYLPAMVGVADQKWASGDKKGALVLYRRILEQSGAGSTYGQRAAARLQQGESGKGSPASQTAEPATAAPVEAPQIDTTDLPGH
jgi:tetratricopeptide (TPR) repeat protein